MTVEEAIREYKHNKTVPPDAMYLRNKYDYYLTFISYEVGKTEETYRLDTNNKKKFIEAQNSGGYLEQYWYVAEHGTSNVVLEGFTENIESFKETNEPRMIALNAVIQYLVNHKINNDINNEEEEKGWILEDAISLIDEVYDMDFFGEGNNWYYIKAVQKIIARAVVAVYRKSLLFPSYWYDNR